MSQDQYAERCEQIHNGHAAYQQEMYDLMKRLNCAHNRGNNKELAEISADMERVQAEIDGTNRMLAALHCD